MAGGGALDEFQLGAQRGDDAQAKQRGEETEGGHIRTPAYLISICRIRASQRRGRGQQSQTITFDVFETRRCGFILGARRCRMKLVLVALAAARLVAAGDFASDFFPANTKVVFGIRVPAIVESALFKDAGTGAQKLSEDWLKVVAITGFDPLHDIDEVLLASPADKENAPALLVLRGRFDLARLGAGAARYHGVAMVGGGKDGKGVLALLDAATAAGRRHRWRSVPPSTGADRARRWMARWRRACNRCASASTCGARASGRRASSRPPARTSSSIRWTASNSAYASARDSNSARRCMRARRRMRRSWRHRCS